MTAPSPAALAVLNRAIYDRLAAGYAARNAARQPAYQRRAAQLASLLRGGRVLDPGCGAGGALRELAAAGFSVTGCDVSPAMLDAAAVTCPDATLILGDFLQVPLAGPFDAICEHAFLHLYPQAAEDTVFQRFRDLLPPGGLLSVNTTDEPASSERWRPKPDYGDRRLHYRRRFTAAELMGVLTAQGFTVIDVLRLDDPDAGKKWVAVTGRRYG